MGSTSFSIEPPDTAASSFSIEPPDQKQGDWLHSVQNFAQGLWSKVNPAAAVTGTAQLAAHPLSSYVSDATQRQSLLNQAEKDFKNGDYAKGVARTLYGVIPFMGPQMASAGTKIGTGDVASGLGESVGLGLAASSPAIARAVPGAVSATGEAIGSAIPETARTSMTNALTTPEGELKPLVRTAAKAGGGLLGYGAGEMLGHPLIGGFLGEQFGPELMRSIAGERAPVPGPELGTPENPGFYAKLPTRMPKQAEPEPEIGTAENPGWVVKLPNRVPKTPAVKAAINDPTSSSFDPDSGVIHVPEPNPVAAGEKPGSMYSVPRAELVNAAMRGKPGAADVLRDLGKPTIIIPRGADFTALRPSGLPSAYEQFEQPTE